ncbi:MAG: hypothetical protein ACI9QC_000595 [Oceanicoccus sp.]|jgi:hypothetical protein
MKRLISSAIVSFSLVLALAPGASADLPWECGNWDDVHSSKVEYLEVVCEHGLMMGYNEDSFGYDRTLLRAELAQIVNRLAVTSDDLYALQEDEEYDLVALAVNDMFSDIPDPNERAHEWMIWTMYFSAIEFDLMEGDDTGGWPTTFRATEGVNTVEAWKMLYEGLKYGGLESDSVNLSSFTYSSALSTAWYDALLTYLDDYDVLAYDGTYVSVNLSEMDGSGDTEDLILSSGLDAELNREDVAYFIYKLIEEGFVDSDAVKEHNGV